MSRKLPCHSTTLDFKFESRVTKTVISQKTGGLAQKIVGKKIGFCWSEYQGFEQETFTQEGQRSSGNHGQC